MLVSYKATSTVDLVLLLWTCSKKYLLGGAAFSANLIDSVSSVDQRKSILEIRERNYGLNLRSFNPFQPGVAFLYFLKASENLKVSNIADVPKLKPYRDFKASISVYSGCWNIKNFFFSFFFFFLFFILRRYKFLIYKFTNSTMNIWH